MAEITPRRRRPCLPAHPSSGEAGLPGKVTTRQASEARRDFFALLNAVVDDPTEIVFIEHKSLPESAALVNAPFLLRTLRLLKQLRARRPSSEPPFRLIGSATLVGDPDDVLTDIRAEERAGRQAKFADL